MCGMEATLQPQLRPNQDDADVGPLLDVLGLQRHLDERLSALEGGDRGALGGEGVPG